MKNFKSYLLMIIILFSANISFATTYPEPQGKLVNDFANILDAPTKDRIEQTLRDFEKKTTNEIAVVLIPDLQGENVDMYAVKLFEKWKIGKKGKDNGLLLLIAVKDRKWRFEVGYGLEGALNDAKCGHIGREYMVPYLKKGDYGKGIEEALSAIIKNIEVSEIPTSPKKIEENYEMGMFLIILAALLGIVILITFYYFQRKNQTETDTCVPEEPFIPPMTPYFPPPPVYTTKPNHHTHHESKKEEESVRRRHDDDDSFSSGSSSISSGSSLDSFDFGGGSSGGAGASGDF